MVGISSAILRTKRRSSVCGCEKCPTLRVGQGGTGWDTLLGGDLAAGAQCASVQKWTIDGSSAVWLIFKLLSHPPMHMVQNIDRSDDDSHHVVPLLERSLTIDRGHGMGGTWDMRHVGPISEATPPHTRTPLPVS